MSKLSRHWNFVRYGIRNRLIRPNLRYKKYKYTPDLVAKIQDWLCKFDTKSAVVFTGLRQAKYSLGFEDPFLQTTELFNQVYDSLIIPTFSPSVRDSRVYDVRATKSEVGVYSQLFMGIADFRTLSPYKSYAVIGPITDVFKTLRYDNDYASGGTFEHIVENAITTINFGTHDLRFGCIHYAEFLAKVPYRMTVGREITVIDHNGESRVVYASEQGDKGLPVKVNGRKIEKDLAKAGLLYQTKINDLIIRVLPDQRYFGYIMERLAANPYYLVD